jgi:hypothetical protein
MELTRRRKKFFLRVSQSIQCLRGLNICQFELLAELLPLSSIPNIFNLDQEDLL